MTDPWVVRYEGYDAQDEGRREALCTVGNGYIATRGAAADCAADDTHYPGTYGAGLFNRLEDRIEGRTVENESMVNLPNWLATRFRIDGGPWFDIDRAEILAYHQELDLRRAVLTRWLRVRDEAGRTTSVTERRLVSMDVKHACALEITYVPEDWSGRLEIRSVLDGTVGNTLVKRYRALSGDHLALVRTAVPSPESVLLEVVTNRSAIRVAMAARTEVWGNGRRIEPQRGIVDEGAVVGHHLTLDAHRSVPVTLEKIVTVFTGRDPAISEPAAEALAWLPRLGRFDDLLERHVLAWEHLWERFHLDIDSDGATVRILRLHLLHLLQSVSLNSVDLDVGVPARGLHGEAYRGHIFWDELFIFPVLNLRVPILTRSLLRYRYRRLPEARVAAREAGHSGAMFPWQSGSDGREENQSLHLNPVSGHWLPDPTARQRHVGIAVAYNVWQYYQVTDDREFLIHYGAEMLLEIARFWGSIATYDRARGRYVIRGVMGPDEFHTGYPGHEQEGIDNNAYTNVMASWVLRRGLETLHLLPAQERHELLERLDLRRQELERWEVIARTLFVPFHDGIISQFEGYDDLLELDWDAYRQKYGNIRRLDRILEAENDTVNRYKASKQADALMLFYLLSADELREVLGHLGYRLPPEAIPRTIHYYLDRTSHGSTLSAIVHSWVLARSERGRAQEFVIEALESDVADIQGGTTAEGIHLASMAGSVDLFQRCFSGLELRQDRLYLTPYWPEPLGAMEFAIRYRGHPLTLRIHGDCVEVQAAPGRQRPIEVVCRGEVAELRPGARVGFPL
ncbi:trehalose 6-phosphate phosphatase [Raineyella antarctica]|uniref:Trehalose 6-phosphate phosphatase n=1 Tax=Raineyella antarctica TaxID=1577474 RepID=A0A1G6I622_9ACTN|nr:glycosyl hydrolase family 65 protein [Raineyella antarctica]SDC01999.1 trehalose 6-phosphate phosphatase [Raineyella antarctica]